MYKEVRFHPEDVNLSEYVFLVTGGAGFIGSHIVEYLLSHQAGKVKVLDNLSEGRIKNLEHLRSNPALEFIEGDCCNEALVQEVMQGVDFVSHQAALGSVPRSVKTPVATNQANVTGFLNVLNAARVAEVKRMVYASSSSVYGDHPVLPKVEEQTGNLLSPYAVSKKVNELYAEVFHRTYGMQVCGLRYFNIFGPRQRPDGPYAAVIPLFIKSIGEDAPVYINGDGLQTRDFTYVENAVQANIKALFPLQPEESAGRVFNVAVGERVTVLKMYEMLCEMAGKQPKAIHRAEREGDIRDSLANTQAAATFLGYNPGVKMDNGLRRTFNWFISNQ